MNYLDEMQLERVQRKIAEEDRFEARLFWRGVVIALFIVALIVLRLTLG